MSVTTGKAMLRLYLFFAVSLVSFNAQSQAFTYDEIAKRYKESSLNQQEVELARMQGECLVGLKELNFKKKTQFDPVAEWTSYRSVSLLEQYSPCEVLIIMEVAQAKLKAANGLK